MIQFHTIEEALEDLRKGRVILVTDDETGKTRGISSVRPSLPPRPTSISWRPMGKG